MPEKLSFSCYFKPSESENTSRREQPQEKTPFVVAVKTTKSSRKLNQCGELRDDDAIAAVSDQAWGGHYKSPTQNTGGGKFVATPVPAVKAPRGHNLTQLTGDDFIWYLPLITL